MLPPHGVWVTEVKRASVLSEVNGTVETRSGLLRRGLSCDNGNKAGGFLSLCSTIQSR